MNKKGFTLAELLASIAILAFISIITTTVVVSFLKKGKEDLYQKQLNNIKLAAKVWVSDHKDKVGECKVLSLEELQKDGYIDDNIKDSRNNKTISKTETKVKITKEGNVYKYEVNPSDLCYTIGTQVAINDDDYYIIEDSPESQDYVTLLKDKPLTVEEVLRYGEGHINQRLSPDSEYYQIPYSFGDSNNTAGVGYCNSVSCSTIPNYYYSEVKYIVDNWSSDNFNSNMVLNSRLIKMDDLVRLGYHYVPETYIKSEETPDWLYSDEYVYWIDYYSYPAHQNVWVVMNDGVLGGKHIFDSYDVAIRPVVEIKKSALEGGNNNE